MEKEKWMNEKCGDKIMRTDEGDYGGRDEKNQKKENG